ncbi:MAG TPA: protein kinase, partial [Vicinamibacterales bacterium]
MPIEPGTRFGPYEIVAPLGAGGMGEVYRARDTRLERTVAVKVLAATVARDPEFRARFEREARSISALNHPHICTLHDVGREGDVEYLVMEYLEGEPLSARLAKGPIPADEALSYAVQIADALDKAHRSGIVHRDLKPANIFLVKGPAASGPAICKLLDFGLAKIGPLTASGIVETKLVTSPPDQAPLTARGSILGTFQYMAPEQIEGNEADARSDIWAFGCVLYEMLTGRRAFEGKSQASLIASILERQPPPIAELQPMTPPALGRIVRTCLEKHPDNRFHTAHDLCLQLQWIDEGGSAAGLPAPVIAGRRRHERTTYAALALGAVILASAGVWTFKPAPAPDGVVGRFALSLPEGQAFTRAGRRIIALSPDGRHLAYIANNQIYLRRMHELTAEPVRGTQMDPVDLVFSPDGEWIAFFTPETVNGGLSNCTLRKISTSGGVPVTLASGVDGPYGIRWQDGTIIYGINGRAFDAVPDTGSTTPKRIVSLDEGSPERISQPSLVNDGRDVLYTLRTAADQWQDGRIVVQPIAGGDRRIILHGGTDGRLSQDGTRLFYVRDSTLFMMPVERGTLAPSGGARPVIEGVRHTSASGAGQYDFSDRGTLVFVRGSSDGGDLSLTWVDRTGREEIIPVPPQRYSYPRVSPDGTRIAVDSRDGDEDVWLWDDVRKTMTKLTSGPERDLYPVWTPDGRSIAYRTDTEGLAQVLIRNANGVGSPRHLLKDHDGSAAPQMALPDGSLLLRADSSTGGSAFLALVPAGGGALQPLFRTDVSQVVGEVSPDGRWIAYQSTESSTQNEIYVRPFPNTEDGRWKISTAGGTMPHWAPSGRELFFVAPNPSRLAAVTVQPSPAGAPFSYGAPETLFDTAPYQIGLFGRGYDLSPDGRRFVFVKREAEEVASQIVVVTN